MRMAVGILLLLLFTEPTWATDINKFVSGSWYNPNQDGHGLSVEVISKERSLIYWFVYHPDGTPTFLLGVGTNHGNVIEADAYYNSGMKFGEFNSASRTQIPWGTFKLTVHGCTSATFEYASQLKYKGVAYGSGSTNMVKLVGIDEMQCAENPNSGLYLGTHYSPSTGFVPAYALLTKNHEFVEVINGRMVIWGEYGVQGNTFVAEGTAVALHPTPIFPSRVSIYAPGEISSDYSLRVNMGPSYGYSELFAISSLYRRKIGFADIAGTYDAKDLVNGTAAPARILSDGRILATNSYGCDFAGQLTFDEPEFNILLLTVEVSKCGDTNGEYAGYGAVLDNERLNDNRKVVLMAYKTNLTRNEDVALIELIR